jgi:ABC-type methionine transport system permease subunit
MLPLDEIWIRVIDTLRLIIPLSIETWSGLGACLVAFLLLAGALGRLHTFGRAGVTSPIVAFFAVIVGLAIFLLGDVFLTYHLTQLGVEPHAIKVARLILPWLLLLVVVIPITRWAFRASYWTSAGAWMISGLIAAGVIWLASHFIS